ncbi:hypothetical protein [Microvirga lotononidis]|uniref:Uncharacterized protein n=1 Tax=Microvirga lotononidis TaxID=864069 RepID=I4YT96_9HYPH|nr:hypothetical protein [Microvirga lotononidis]EIM27188.1 hypothetical protein MicloDRAFT_00037440 [Microvirga lotononidis]WQO28631.1 hypothetical protein U0023_06025 [Microvirga lotononidis]
MTEYRLSTINYDLYVNSDKDGEQFRLRMNFSLAHLGAAASFSRLVGEGEQEQIEKATADYYERAFANSSACVLSSVAAVEAYANELFFDRGSTFPGYASAVLDKLWEDYERKSILPKFDYALVLRGCPTLKQDAASYKDMELLIKLRNALVHFKPEWEDEPKAHKKLSDRLIQRIKPSLLASHREMIFPGAWFSHSCTKWAVETAISFIDDFEEQAGLPSKLKSHKSLLEA